jgi:hypothetical protein
MVADFFVWIYGERTISHLLLVTNEFRSPGCRISQEKSEPVWSEAKERQAGSLSYIAPLPHRDGCTDLLRERFFHGSLDSPEVMYDRRPAYLLAV